MMGKTTMMTATTVPSHAGSPFWRQTLRLTAAAAVLGSLLGLAPVGLESAHGAQASHLRVGTNAYGRTQNLEVGLNKSIIVDLPADVHEVIVSQPGVASAIVRSKRRAIIQGVGSGGTNIFFLDRRGDTIAVLDVSVGDDGGNLVATLARVIPGSSIQVQTFGENVVLSGSVQSGDDLEKALAIAGQFAGSPEQVASTIAVSGSQQVMLKIVVAEVRRDVLKQLGINLAGSMTVGPVTLGLNSTAAAGANDITGAITGSNYALNVALEALNQRDALHLLAEPTLTTMSGAPAELLVGGELPIETTDSSGRSNTEWKPFGVELEFTPTVKSNGIIALNIETAVSELRTDGALNKRSVGTNVELPSGQTLAIAGIIQESVRQRIAGLPGLGDIPILGALFRSREYQRSETELVILATPYIAHINDVPVLPTEKTRIASDAEAIFLGHMEKTYGVGPGGMRGSYDGSIGFVLD